MTVRPTAQVEPYHRILGEDLTVEFLLTFGGAELYFAKNPGRGSAIVQLVGRERAAQLALVSSRLPARVPTALPYIAAVLHSKGLPKAQIARRLHVTDVTVRKWLKAAAANTPKKPDQPSLFD